MSIGRRAVLGLFLVITTSSAFAQTTRPAAATPLLNLPGGSDRVVIPLETADMLLFAKVNVDGPDRGSPRARRPTAGQREVIYHYR